MNARSLCVVGRVMSTPLRTNLVLYTLATIVHLSAAAGAIQNA